MNPYKIGGPGIIVEIDESKFGKRKYNRHRVVGVWIVGAAERTPKRRMFAVPVLDRTTETVFSIIDSFIEKGSIIYSDFWKPYDGAVSALNNHFEGGFDHDKVNHSNEYVTETGCHTNTIEGTWNGLKIGIPPHRINGKKIIHEFHVFAWKRQNKGRLWSTFVEALREVYYD